MLKELGNMIFIGTQLGACTGNIQTGQQASLMESSPLEIV
jgi:hypothetical protein